MESFLHSYFGWQYVGFFAIAILVVWMGVVGLLARKGGKKKSKNLLLKKWWFWTGTILVVLHMSWVSYINPSYFGYGTPASFSLIEVDGNNLILYDYKYAYIEDDNSSHEENIPNLRVHVIDRQKHERTYWGLIGDYYYPIFYGGRVLLKENNTYSNTTNDNEIQSLKYFNVEKKKVKTLAENEGTIKVGNSTIKVYDIIMDAGDYKVQSVDGRLYTLNSKTLTFQEKVKEIDASPTKSPFRLGRSSNSKDIEVLYVNDLETGHEFLDGNIVNELTYDTTNYALIHFQEDLTESNPGVSLVNDSGALLWIKSVSDLKSLSADSGLKYIHRTLLFEDVCYITSNEHIFEFDLQSGKLNWKLSL